MDEQTREKYLTDLNVNFRMSLRGYRANLTLAQLSGEILPETAKALKDELIACALLMEQSVKENNV